MGLPSILGKLFRVTPPVDPRVKAARESVTEFLNFNQNPCVTLEGDSSGSITLLHTPREGEDVIISRMRAFDSINGLTILMEYG